MQLNSKWLPSLAFGCAMSAAAVGPAYAQIAGQFGILDVTANGGINPNTGSPWQIGDQYRLAFYTASQISATSDDPAFYDNFATEQAQQNPALLFSTGWTAMVWVNTDSALPQAQNLSSIQPGESPISSPLVRGGYDDTTGGAGIGGAGVPVFAMDGSTAIARNNADILNNWSNPFAGDTQVRLASGSTNLDSNGNSIVASQNVHYSPFLDQFGLGDTANIHGADTWTGGFANPVNPLGNSVDPNGQTRASWGSSNANNGGRTWNRFQSGTSSAQHVYALSPLLTIGDGTPPSILTLRVDTRTGEMTFVGGDNGAVQMDYYQLTSAGNTFDTSGWNSLADQDFDGNGPANGSGNGWEEAGGSSAGVLAEAYLLGESSFAEGQVVSLGTAYDTSVDARDIAFEYSDALRRQFIGLVEYFASNLPGDTDGDGDIDDADLGTAFANYTGPIGALGSKTAAQGDTDGDGDVDDADLGTSFSNYTGPLTANVPEPSGVLLLGLGGMMLIKRRREG